MPYDPSIRKTKSLDCPTKNQTSHQSSYHNIKEAHEGVI